MTVNLINSFYFKVDHLFPSNEWKAKKIFMNISQDKLEHYF